jgi:ABC-type Zn uptake system ZnuABC Zn-binding protein ZnuA
MSEKNRILLLFVMVMGWGVSSTAQTKIKVVATASMIADMADQIAGELITMECIVPIGADPHIYEATPKDVQLVAKADIVLKNGLTFEGWLNELIENSGTQAEVITVSQGIEPIASQVYKNATDPHAWMDATLGIKYVDNITEALIRLDPKHADTYRQNAANYVRILQETDAYILEQIKKIPSGKRILVTSHDAFQYYGRRYGIQLESILGTSTDADVQTSDILRLNKVIKESQIPALFVESTINPKILEQLARDNKIKIGGKLFADSIGDKDSEAPTYNAMLRHNTDVIVMALTAQAESTNPDAQPESSKTIIPYILIGIVLLILLIILIRKLNI